MQPNGQFVKPVKVESWEFGTMTYLLFHFWAWNTMLCWNVQEWSVALTVLAPSAIKARQTITFVGATASASMHTRQNTDCWKKANKTSEENGDYSKEHRQTWCTTQTPTNTDQRSRWTQQTFIMNRTLQKALWKTARTCLFQHNWSHRELRLTLFTKSSTISLFTFASVSSYTPATVLAFPFTLGYNKHKKSLFCGWMKKQWGKREPNSSNSMDFFNSWDNFSWQNDTESNAQKVILDKTYNNGKYLLLLL